MNTVYGGLINCTRWDKTHFVCHTSTSHMQCKQTVTRQTKLENAYCSVRTYTYIYVTTYIYFEYLSKYCKLFFVMRTRIYLFLFRSPLLRTFCCLIITFLRWLYARRRSAPHKKTSSSTTYIHQPIIYRLAYVSPTPDGTHCTPGEHTNCLGTGEVYRRYAQRT